MFKVIGIETQKVYIEAETKAECFRKLKENYPSSYKGINHRHRKNNEVAYPEPLRILKVREKAHRKRGD